MLRQSPIGILVENRDFGLLWLGQLLSSLGTSFSIVALPLLMLAIGGSSIELGIVAALMSASNLALLLLGGVLVDRLARRRMVIAIELVRALALGAVALAALTGVLTVWMLYASAVVTGAMIAFFTPASNALIAEVVPRARLGEANSWRALGLGLSRVVGGSLAALVVVVLGPAIAIGLDALSYLANAGFVRSVRAGQAAFGPRAPLLTSARAGFAAAWRSAWVRWTISIFAVTNAVTGALVQVALPLAAVAHLGGPIALGTFASASAAGTLLAAGLLTQLRVQRRRGVLAYVASAVGTAGLAVVPLGGSAAGAAVGGLLFGIGSQMFGIIWNTSLQQVVPGDMIGRVTSLDWFVSLLLVPIGNLAVAQLLVTVDPSVLMIAGGSMAAAIKLLALALPSVRDFDVVSPSEPVSSR